MPRRKVVTAVVAADEGATFIGRRPYLIRLSEVLRQARAGRPQLVVVEGEPGIGKTRLVHHWLNSTFLTGGTVIGASCDASETDLSFGVVTQLMAQVPAEAGAGVIAHREIAPNAGPLQVGAQMLRLLDEVQATGPVVIVVDDVQWADRASLHVLSFVLRQLDVDAVLTVLIRTPGQAWPAGGAGIRSLVEGGTNVSRLILHGLNASEIRRMAAALHDRTISVRMARQLHQHTGGNPLYVHTVLAALSNEHFRRGPGDALPVPPSLSAAVHRQLEALPGDARRLLDAAAVFGGPAPLALVGDVAEVGDPLAAAEPLRAARLIRRRQGTQIAMAHGLLREAVLSSITPSRLRALHARAAARVDQAAAWRHRVAAAASTHGRLARELEDAAEENFTTGAVARGTTLLLWAADLSSRPAERERRLLTAAAQLMWTDQFARVDALMPEIQISEHGPLRSLVLGAHATSQGALTLAEKHLLDALRGAENDPDLRWVLAMAATWLGTTHLMSRCEEARAVFEAVVAMPDVDPRLTSRAAGNLTIACGFVEGPRAGLDRLAEVVSSRGDAGSTDVYLLSLRGMLRTCAGDFAGGLRDLDAARLSARGSEAAMVTEFAHSCAAAAHYFRGEWDSALIHSRYALTVILLDNKSWAGAFAHAVAAWVPAGRGDWKRAEELLFAAEDWASGFEPRFALPPVAIGRALLAQARTDHAAMLEALEPVAALPAPGVRTLLLGWWLPLYVEALIGTGDEVRAGRRLAEFQRLAEESPGLRVPAAWLTGWLAEKSGNLEAAITAYEAGTSLPVDPVDRPLYRGLLEEACGRALVLAGRTRAGRGWLSRACQRFEVLHARPFLDRCRAELPTSASDRPRWERRDGHRFGGARLSDRERDIAYLVSRAHTNREIANELLISTKTVEYHLSNVYAKLNVANRRQLRDFMRSADFGSSPAS